MVVMLTLLAAGLRLYALDRLPPGLYRDEAFNGLDALRVLEGEHPVFFEANNGREPLFIYLVALSVAFFGQSPGAIRLVSACLGTLTIPATYLMAKEMFDRRVGLLAAFLMATSLWSVNLSRVGFRAIAMPFFMALMIWSFWRGLRRDSWGDFIAAGLWGGLGFYTYLAARFTVLFWIILAGYLLITKKRQVSWGKFALFAMIAFIIAAPLLWYFLGHRAALLGRSAQISVFNPAISGGDPAGMLVRQAVESILMFVYRGDFIPRHNMPLRPAYDPLIAPFFVGGLLLCLSRCRKHASEAFALIWVGIMLLPTILAEGAPHFLRAVGVLPVACVFPALALDVSIGFLERRAFSSPVSRVAVWGLCGLILAASAALTTRDYFVKHVHSEAVYYNLEAGATELAAQVNQLLGQGWAGRGIRAKARPTNELTQVYLDRRLWEGWPSLRYLIPMSSRLSLWATDTIPPALQTEADVWIACWPYADYRSALALLPPNSIITSEEGAKERGDLEQTAKLLYVTFSGKRAGDVPQNITQRFEQGITLLGQASRLASPIKLSLRLYWRADSSLQESYTVFAHVRRGEQMIGQDDARPAGGRYPTSFWRPGDIIVDEHVINLSSPHISAQDEIWVGLYRLETGQRLQLLNDMNEPSGDHVVFKTAWLESD